MPGIIREDYLIKIKPYIDQAEIIKVITGMRRSGKSYLLKQLIAEAQEQHKHIVFIDKESLEFENIKDYKDLNNYVTENSTKDNTSVFIDEIQEIKDWEKAIRSLYNSKKYDLYITGSNSEILSSDLSTHLTGRYVEFLVQPLSFAEFLQFRSNKVTDIEQEFWNYIRYGGLPSIHLMDFDDEVTYNLIRSIYNTILLKDVVKKYEIRNVALLENICRYAFSHLGSNLSAQNISKFLKSEKISAGNDTIQNYLNYNCNAFLLNKATNYDIQGKKIFTINGKYFANDLGIKHAVLGYKAGDISGILENIVYQELRHRGYEVHVGKLGDLEVDFIAQKQGEKIYIQVAYLLEQKETLERELRPLQKIYDNYAKYILTLDKSPNSEFDGIRVINLIDWLLELRNCKA